MKIKLLLCLALVLGGPALIKNCHAAIIFAKLPDGCPPMTSPALTDLVRSHHFIFSDVRSTNDLQAIGPFRSYIIQLDSLSPGRLAGSQQSDSSPQMGRIDKLCKSTYELYYSQPTNNSHDPRDQILSGEICHDYLMYMVLQGTNLVDRLNVGLDAANHWKTFGTYSSMGLPDPMWVAYQEAKEMPQIKKRDYEFRFLMFLPLDLQAVWLRGQTDDIVIPFPWGYATPWKGCQPYSISKLAGLLRGQPDPKKGG